MAYLGRNPAIGTQKVLDSLESQFDGVLTTFDLRYASNTVYPTLPSSLIVSLGGVLQEPGTAYTVVSDQIEFTTAPSVETDCWILLYSEFGAQTASGGSSTFVGLSDTPTNFTNQAGKYLKVNANATALEYVTLPVDPDTNTTYSQSSVGENGNVKLRLTDSGSTNDDILITAGSNIAISSVTADGFTIASTASGGSSTFVGLSDTPNNFTNAANKNVVVNNAGNALEFVASGTSSNEILPVAYAFVNADTAGTGTGMTWGAYDNNNSSATYGEMDFTFGTPLSDANYYVLSEREQYDTHSVRITNKTTGGFTATWLGNDGSSPLAPSTFGGVLIVYASTPTKSVGAGWNEALPTATASVLGAIKIGSGLSIDSSSGVVTASDGITVEDQGSALSTTATTLDFVGSGVVASGTGATKTITIAGGGGGGGGVTTGKAIAMAMIFG